jgi:hypothetical protein
MESFEGVKPATIHPERGDNRKNEIALKYR